MKGLHVNKMDTWLRNLSVSRKRVGGWENKGNLGRMKQTTLGKLRGDLADVEMIGSTWRETRRLKRIDMTISMIERISTPIEIWGHRLGKVWNQHLTMKQLEYHNSKQNKGFGLQNKPEQTYDRDFVRSFRGGAHTGSIVQHHHVQGSAHDIRSVPESA